MTEDFSQWRELRRVSTSYLVWDEITRDGALFDISDVDGIGKMIESESIQLRHVFLTYEHPVEELRARFPKFLLHTNSKSALPQHRNRPNDFIHLGSLRITNRGLVDDKVAYVIGNWPEDAPHVAIVGNVEEVCEAIFREKILSLPKGTLICPMKGTISTLQQS
jgi:hypothetical protein